MLDRRKKWPLDLFDISIMIQHYVFTWNTKTHNTLTSKMQVKNSQNCDLFAKLYRIGAFWTGKDLTNRVSDHDFLMLANWRVFCTVINRFDVIALFQYLPNGAMAICGCLAISQTATDIINWSDISDLPKIIPTHIGHTCSRWDIIDILQFWTWKSVMGNSFWPFPVTWQVGNITLNVIKFVMSYNAVKHRTPVYRQALSASQVYTCHSVNTKHCKMQFSQ